MVRLSRLFPCKAAVTGLALVPYPGAIALGQDVAEQAEVRLDSAPAIPADDRLAIEPILRTGSECGARQAVRAPLSGTLACPYAANSQGIAMAPQFDLPDGRIRFTLGFARGTDGALSLGRQLQRTNPARQREATLAILGTEANLFGGRLEFGSTIGWSRSWERDIVPSPAFQNHLREEAGFSQRHTLKALILDRPDLRWRAEGTLARAGEDFRTDSIYWNSTPLMGQGNETSLSTRLTMGEFDLRASYADRGNFLSQGISRKLSLGYSGISLGYLQRSGRTIPNDMYPVALSQSRSETTSLEIDLFSLAPMIAMGDSGWASLLPKQFTLSRTRRDVTRPGNALRPQTSRTGIGLFGMWDTPLGDTLVDFSQDRLADGFGNPIERTSQLLVSQGFSINSWRISLDMLSMRTRAADHDDDATLYYGASLARKFASGAKVKLEFGRDSLSFGGIESDFALRDKSHKVKFELDLSAPLQRKLENSSAFLTLAAQWRLNRSDYQLRFLDELIDSGTDGFARQGVLATFGFSF